MKTIIALLVAAFLVGCSPMKPIVVYETKEVKVPVPVFVETPDIGKFDSSVMLITDQTPTGEVAQAYKIDWMILMERDKLFTDFLSTYNKARKDAQATKTD